MRLTYLLFLIFLLCFVPGSESDAQEVWLTRYNGPSNGNDGSNAITIDAQGNTYVAGYSTGIGTMRDITTLKYDANGRLLWSRTYNGSGSNEDEAYAITIDASGNIYVGGVTTSLLTGRDIIVLKYNNNGVQQWVEKHSGPGLSSDEAYAITVDGLGNPIVTGYSFDISLGAQMTVLKYDPSGNMQWLELFNAEEGSGADVAYAITVDGANDIYVTGYSELSMGDASVDKDMVTVKISANGQRRWAKKIDISGSDDEGYSIAVDENKNVFITGYTTSSNGKDYTTIKYDKNGNEKWKKTFDGHGEDDIPAKLVIDQSGNVVVTGSTKSDHGNNKENYMTIKYGNSNGNELFKAEYDGGNHYADIPNSLTTRDGKYYVVGSSEQTNLGSNDIVVIEYQNNGSLKSRYRVNNVGNDAGNDIKVDNSGNIMIAGDLSGSANLDMGAGRITDGDNHGFEEILLNVTYEYDMSVLNNIGPELPDRFNLEQNFPNPFNPSTSIKFNVGSESLVKIAIFDALGREISTPVNDYLKAGSYEVSLNLSKLSSGIYFYKMTSGSFTDIKKMMLIK